LDAACTNYADVARGRKVMRIPRSARFEESRLSRCHDVNPPGVSSSPRRRPSPSRQYHREWASDGRARRFLCLASEPIAEGQASMRVVRPLVGSRCGMATQHVRRSPHHEVGLSLIGTDILTPSGRRATVYGINANIGWEYSVRLGTSAWCKTLLAANILDNVATSC
jgi:hypothetical protein